MVVSSFILHFFRYIFVTVHFNFLSKGQILMAKKGNGKKSKFKLLIFTKYNFFFEKVDFFSPEIYLLLRPKLIVFCQGRSYSLKICFSISYNFYLEMCHQQILGNMFSIVSKTGFLHTCRILLYAKCVLR